MIEVGFRRGALLTSACAVLFTLVVFTVGEVARAESALRLPYPDSFGAIPAATYDADHHRVGDATVVVENVDASHVRLRIESGIDGGAHTIATADLVSVDEGRALRLLRQESRSVGADGISMGVLAIDHESGIASCTKSDGPDTTRKELTLPPDDRVANVPLNLLFQPLVEGTTEEVSFQLLLCRFGARLVDIDAHVVPHDLASEQSSIVEVEFQPNFGSAISLLAKKWIPKLSVWFDRHAENRWVAHRIPLYSKGPEVFVIRDGFPGTALGGLN
jgi:hypothetical protein